MVNNPPKILHITFNMGIGGTEQVIRQLVLAMDPLAAKHQILCIDGAVGPLGEMLQDNGVNVTSMKRAQGFDRELIRALRARIREERFDVVHCHQYTPFIYGRLGAFGTRAKVVFTEHGRFYPDRYRYKAMLINPILALFTPAIVAISKATRDALARYEFMPKGRIKVIYNGIGALKKDPEQTTAIRRYYGIPEDAFVFGTVSRLDPVKNQSMMIRAFGQVLAAHPNSLLLIVGDGPERQNLEALAAELQLEKSIIFTGFKTEPAQYQSAMDAFILSSFTEGTSMTLLEAMSLNLPIIATAVGGNTEIIEDQTTGLLTPNDDTPALAAAMGKIAHDRFYANRLGENAGKRFTKQYSAKAMAKAYLSLYTQLLKAQ